MKTDREGVRGRKPPGPLGQIAVIVSGVVRCEIVELWGVGVGKNSENVEDKGNHCCSIKKQKLNNICLVKDIAYY